MGISDYTDADMVSYLVTGSRWIPHQRTANQLHSLILALATENSVVLGGVHHPDREGIPTHHFQETDLVSEMIEWW